MDNGKKTVQEGASTGRKILKWLVTAVIFIAFGVAFSFTEVGAADGGFLKVFILAFAFCVIYSICAWLFEGKRKR